MGVKIDFFVFGKNEMIIYLEKILFSKEKSNAASALIKNAQKLRNKTKAYYLTENKLNAIKSEGRSLY